jgi:hypothetical protein
MQQIVAGRGEIEDPNNPHECHCIVAPYTASTTHIWICEWQTPKARTEKMVAYRDSRILKLQNPVLVHQAWSYDWRPLVGNDYQGGNNRLPKMLSIVGRCNSVFLHTKTKIT